MGDKQRQALADSLAQDHELREAMKAAPSVEEALRIAAEHGLSVTEGDLVPHDDGLSDAELEFVSGGTMLHPTMSVFCGTNGSFCTFNPYACGSPG